MDELELEFELHPQLVEDCVLLGNFPLCTLLLLNDSNYPWFVLVPRRVEVSEIYHLPEHEQRQLMHESTFLAENLADLYAAHKMNIAALGNMVPQLHLHHIVRFRDDPAWPAPVWGKVPAKPYTVEELYELRHKLEFLMDAEIQFEPHDP
ncbi:HIT domain-containing protein [Marinobacterium arenosum]|uniref:HIT domain-containing protein n=1 Tax=Marinobacterium arenosum TaxID=2862496 RepID=UPI001C947B64|nr:HIT family protein [Marinobacterium arenosum]MBY4675304.1 HIT family protein [Marinobacterium arenosum]